ncbi:MAG: C39 family peptidase [Anaerolineaceae bacterium]|nr:C39 family peptidase [Anaerolineaceae bacterium]
MGRCRIFFVFSVLSALLAGSLLSACSQKTDAQGPVHTLIAATVAYRMESAMTGTHQAQYDASQRETPSPEPTVTPYSDTQTPFRVQETPFSKESQEKPSASNYPESFYIKGIVGHDQTYALSCEASAAVDWANFFGTLIYESNFQAELPVSDNPDFGYVGVPTTKRWGQTPPYAYGVHAEPVAALLSEYGLPAQSKKNYTLEEVKQKISESKPVLIWIVGNMEYSVPVEYTDQQGRKSIVAPYEHAVILTGYDQYTVRYMNNGKFFDVPTDVFLTSWGVLGNMAVIYE